MQASIGLRLQAIAKKLANTEVLPAEILHTELKQSESTTFEVAVMGVLASELALDTENIAISDLRQSVDKQGYNALATNTGIRMLLKKGFIESSQEQDCNGYLRTFVLLNSTGWDWIEKNMEKFSLRREMTTKTNYEGRMQAIIGDDIPF